MAPADPAVPMGGEALDEEAPWDPWHPREVADRLAGVTAPWCVVGGWAIDLFHGAQTRAHEDVEIAVPAAGFLEVRPSAGRLRHRRCGSRSAMAAGRPGLRRDAPDVGP